MLPYSRASLESPYRQRQPTKQKAHLTLAPILSAAKGGKESASHTAQKLPQRLRPDEIRQLTC